MLPTFKFIPTTQDYLENMELLPWMNNAMGGTTPNSCKKIVEKEKENFNEFHLSGEKRMLD